MTKILLSMVSLFLLANPAIAQQYEGTTVSKSLSRSGANLEGEGQFSFELSADIYRITSEFRWVNERVWECKDDGDGDGSSGDWKGFFNVPKAQKAGALADAIRGVGLSTAKRLVSDNYFNSKPRSWRAFSRVIESADDEYETGFSYEVLGKFKEDNMKNLGYVVEGECGYVTKRVYRRVPVRKFHRTERTDFVVDITNAPILRGEKETFKVIYDGFDSEIRVGSRYNSYSVNRFEEGGRIVFELRGERQRVQPGNTLELNADIKNRSFVLQVKDLSFDEGVDAEAVKVIEGVVKKDGFAFFNKTLAKFRATLDKDGSVTIIDNINAAVKPGMKILIQYRMTVKNSEYYNNSQSSQSKYKTKL